MISLMRKEDLDQVLEIENNVFSDPWPRKYFEDYLDNECLQACMASQLKCKS